MTLKIKMQDCTFSYMLVQKQLRAEARHPEHLTALATSVTIQWLLFCIWLCFSWSVIQPFHKPAVWLCTQWVQTHPGWWPQWVNLRSGMQRCFSLAAARAGLAMPVCALPQLDRKLCGPGWQIYTALHWAMETHQLGCLSWVPLGLCSWLS